MDIGIDSSLELLWITLLETFTYRPMCNHICLFLLSKYLRVESNFILNIFGSVGKLMNGTQHILYLDSQLVASYLSVSLKYFLCAIW